MSFLLSSWEITSPNLSLETFYYTELNSGLCPYLPTPQATSKLFLQLVFKPPLIRKRNNASCINRFINMQLL